MADEKKPRLALVDDALVIRSILTNLLKTDYDIVGDAGNGRDAIDLAEKLKPEIILMDVTMPIMDGIEATRQITSRFPDIDIVILSAVSSDTSVKAGLAAGARDYLFKPPQPEEIKTVLTRLVRQRAERKNQGGATGLPGKGIWTFCSALGGDGRTTLAISFANELLTLGRRVVVVDADLTFGDVGFYLGVTSTPPTFAELLDPRENLTEKSIEDGMKKHPSGLHFLGKPALGKPSFDTPPERIIELVHKLMRQVDYVLVDLPTGVPDKLLPLLDDSRFIFPISRGLPEKLQNLKVLVDVLGICGFAPPRVQPLLTRTDQEAVGKVVASLKIPVQEYFPTDEKAVEEATRAAQPVTRIAPRSPYTQKIRDFLGKLLGVTIEEKKEAAGKSLMQRLLGKA